MIFQISSVEAMEHCQQKVISLLFFWKFPYGFSLLFKSSADTLFNCPIGTFFLSINTIPVIHSSTLR